MRIVTARRISQGFFLVLFFWFCLAATVGGSWWRLSGWPVNWFLHLDPLLALSTVLTTGTLYKGLLWAVATLVLAFFLGRVFCGWICPLGAMQQIVGWLFSRGKKRAAQKGANRPGKYQAVKYYLLFALLSAAGAELVGRAINLPASGPPWAWGLAGLIVLGVALRALWLGGYGSYTSILWAFLWVDLWLVAGYFAPMGGFLAGSLQTGLLDPIPLVYRSVNLALLPLLDSGPRFAAAVSRAYQGAWLIGGIFVAILLFSAKRPRFYCRYVCPLGALLGLCGQTALWRIHRPQTEQKPCGLCEAHCQGACAPTGDFKQTECLMCMNCLDTCVHGQIDFASRPAEKPPARAVDFTRRGVAVSLAAGLFAPALMKLGGDLRPEVMRPPGSLEETAFLERCTKCGQCMRVCPTGVIQPAGLEAGLEGLWTPILNFRLGTSGCHPNCVACGHVCPTAAIKPLSLEERQGKGKFAARGPVRLGTAFVDRNRCLPWAYGRPCIVCQENCPVSPKAIYTSTVFQTVRGGELKVAETAGGLVRLAGWGQGIGGIKAGDNYLAWRGPAGPARAEVAGQKGDELSLALAKNQAAPTPGATAYLQVRLQQPFVDPARCIGCGICQHECPLVAVQAIRVGADNETRSRKRPFL